ncbi:MAG: amino acid dehydrogenase [Planctomycetes bacterium]|jgi:leucine dehydrogenase|nr:amino acid dehydrogenase [Planctomycetota bacterium]
MELPAHLDPLPSFDGERLLLVHDRAAAATVLVAVHDTRLGPAHGGIRRWAYADRSAALRDVIALARAMTWKCALAEVPAGGGKCVILDHPGLDRAAAYRLVGRTVAELGGRYFTGPDVGTTEADLQLVAAHTSYVATGDTAGDLTGATALGVMAAIAALAERLGLPLPRLHLAVQGLGAVGLRLCELLAAAGARLTVADVMPARVAAAAALGAAVVAPEAIVHTACHVFVPCALGGVLTAGVARTLPARAVCGAANNILADAEAGFVLHGRGVLVVPDFVANAGALIQGALWHLRGERVTAARIQRIGITTGQVLDRAQRDNLPPGELALAMARERVERAP